MSLTAIKKELKSKANPRKAKISQGFFKTGPGEYGEGDVFLGITVPETRNIAKKYSDLKFSDIKNLLKSKIHDERLVALLILVDNFQSGNDGIKRKIYKFYLANTRYINSWDLVDLSADKIIGAYLFDNPKNILHKLSKSRNFWERRIGIIATFHFIKNNQFKDALELSKILLNDEHDLIHKAVGWMLREIGKRDLRTEEKFLKKYYKEMPRTTLRYAIEKFPSGRRKAYLLGRI